MLVGVFKRHMGRFTWFIAPIKAVAILIVDVGVPDGLELVQAGEGSAAGCVVGQESRIKAPDVLAAEHCGWEELYS